MVLRKKRILLRVGIKTNEHTKSNAVATFRFVIKSQISDFQLDILKKINNVCYDFINYRLKFGPNFFPFLNLPLNHTCTQMVVISIVAIYLAPYSNRVLIF